MLSDEELQEIVDKAINIYKHSDEYARKALLNIEDITYIMLEDDPYYADKGILYISIDKKLKFNGEYIPYEQGKEYITVHVTTDIFRNFNDRFDIHYNFQRKFKYVFNIDKKGKYWWSDKHEDDKVYCINLVQSYKEGFGSVYLNCELEDCLILEFGSVMPMFYKSLARLDSKLENSSIYIKSVPVNIKTLINYTDFDFSFKNKVYLFESVIQIHKSDLNEYKEFLNHHNIDLDECSIDVVCDEDDLEEEGYKGKNVSYYYFLRCQDVLVSHYNSLEESEKEYIKQCKLSIGTNTDDKYVEEHIKTLLSYLQERYGDIYII